MRSLPDQMVAEAFALSNARGADLLARLGAFKVWRGDLATMRGDNPRASMATDETDDSPAAMQGFTDVLMLVRAIELLQPNCRAALAAVYAEHRDTNSTTADCRQRLLEIYDSLSKGSLDGAAAIPEWISEREHAASGGSGRR